MRRVRQTARGATGSGARKGDAATPDVGLGKGKPGVDRREPTTDRHSIRHVCQLCGRQGQGWGVVQGDGGFGKFPVYHCCGSVCGDALLRLIEEGKGWIMAGPTARITQMEAQAIVDARQSLWDALVRCGNVTVNFAEISVSSVFAELSPEQIDMIIEATWAGLRASMQRQSARGEVPVAIGDAAAARRAPLTDMEIPF